jgi:hypothetical protein
MSWFKMGRWLLVGMAAAGAASACGGRGNLPTGAADTGGQPFGTGGSTAGSAAGGTAVAGTNSFGGKVAVGGTPAVGGTVSVAGMPGVCVPGLGMCEGNSLAICSGAGNGYTIRDCPKGQRCLQFGDSPICQPLLCTPGQMQCDPAGKFVQVCSPDGLLLENKLNCGLQGQRCQSGVCRSLACQPNLLYCDKAGVRLCNADGSGSVPWENCGAGQYCDPLALACKTGICSPGQPACNGSIATICNAAGSGYLPKGVDCGKLPDRQCELGACLCPPDLADCDGEAKTGCEANVSTDPDNCTGCGFACSNNHVAKRTCDDGCTGTCAAGFGDCNGDKYTDGCETQIASDVENCGGCGLACSNRHVKASCSSGQCDGACAPNFADCNGDKLADGCESDARVDTKNCGACGIACSTNHVTPLCMAGTCAGPCRGGFDDCNGDKQADGCEVDTQNDEENCGGCGNVCADGSSCLNGKCDSLFTFTGVAQDVAIASLTGWSQCYAEAYGEAVTRISDITATCSGSLLMMACRPLGSSVLQLAAYAPRADVLYDTGLGNDPHVANGVGWYFNGSHSWGFAPEGATLTRNSCDTEDSSINADGIDGDLRLCWHTGDARVQGGWRCGYNDVLNGSFAYERLLFQAP